MSIEESPLACGPATGEAIAKFLYEEITMRFGCPQEMSDRGPNFMSNVICHYLARLDKTFRGPEHS
jgi:hypothetical protein